jgi:hypothetical protein
MGIGQRSAAQTRPRGGAATAGASSHSHSEPSPCVHEYGIVVVAAAPQVSCARQIKPKRRLRFIIGVKGHLSLAANYALLAGHSGQLANQDERLNRGTRHLRRQLRIHAMEGQSRAVVSRLVEGTVTTEVMKRFNWWMGPTFFDYRCCSSILSRSPAARSSMHAACQYSEPAISVQLQRYTSTGAKGGLRIFRLPCYAFDPVFRLLTDLGLESHE